MSKNSDILDYRLPSRLAELNTFIVLASALEAHGSHSLELKVGSDSYIISDPKLLLYVIADGAVMIARMLLNFLGLSYQKSPPALSSKTWNSKSDDLKITDLGLPIVTPTAAVQHWIENEIRAEQLLKLCFETGNKVSAHFTTESALSKSATISELRQAFELVIKLVNREVYKPLKRSDVDFNSSSTYGNIMKK